MRKQLPPRDLPWFDPATGRPTDIFYDYLKNLESRSLANPVSITDTPANGDAPVFNSTTGQWEYAAN